MPRAIAAIARLEQVASDYGDSSTDLERLRCARQALSGLRGTVLVAGERYVRDGLVAAIGVHFRTDVVWHVLWPLAGLSG